MGKVNLKSYIMNTIYLQPQLEAGLIGGCSEIFPLWLSQLPPAEKILLLLFKAFYWMMIFF